jgi:hypothetical protein
MKRNLWSPAIAVMCFVFAWAAPKGTVPRSSATQYAAHGQQDGVMVGARLLSPSEVRRTFVSDLSHCCIVLEIAVFPQSGQSVPVSLDDMSLHVAGRDTSTKPSSVRVVAAALQKHAREERDITVSPATTIGYESGPIYDPARGTVRGGGVYTGAGVGVGVGQRGDQPGASDKDRAVMETELNEKGLAEGPTTNPVAGYVYFQISAKSHNTKYQLQYTLNGNRMNLALP